MSAERDVNRIVRSWIRAEEHESADRVLQTVLSRLDTTPQRRSLWPARRFVPMNNFTRGAIATAAVLAVAIVGYNLLPGTGDSGGQPTPGPTAAPSPSPSPTPRITLPPGTYESIPFAYGGLGMCGGTGCAEDPRDETIRITFRAPDSWETSPSGTWPVAEAYLPPGGAAVTFTRGNWLYSEPCRSDDSLAPDVEVGPTVDDFVSALVQHPLLEVTAPVDVTLAGYSGKYLELQVPADISACVSYRPLEGHIYAQGPGHRWHMWVLDVGGVRVLIETDDFPATSAQRREEMQGIVDSIVITP